MKHLASIELKDKSFNIALTLGALEDFQDYLDEQGVEGGIEVAMTKMKHMRALISIMAEYAGDKVDANELKFLELDQIAKVNALFERSFPNPDKAKGEGKG